MKISRLLDTARVCFLVLFTSSAHALTISPTDCGDGTGGTLVCETGTETAESVIRAYIESTYGVTELYKMNVGSPEEGSFAGSYSTSFGNTPTDPANAWIQFDGAPSISCPTCYLLVKDGNHSPAWYLFNIDSWNGMDDINLEGFWPAQGAISHVSIYGGEVPAPAAMWLFGSGLLGLLGISRRKKDN
jgi:hypothetical protein